VLMSSARQAFGFSWPTHSSKVLGPMRQSNVKGSSSAPDPPGQRREAALGREVALWREVLRNREDVSQKRPKCRFRGKTKYWGKSLPSEAHQESPRLAPLARLFSMKALIICPKHDHSGSYCLLRPTNPVDGQPWQQQRWRAW
jgi:hypothetical protein